MSSPLKVLIVEDEAIIATDIEMLLQEAGIEVVGWATNVANAISLAAANRPDLAVVDIQLRRGEDGIDLARHLNENFGVEIIFLTAQSDSATVKRAQTVRHLAYVGKPYIPERLLSLIRQAAVQPS